ncbi:MAG: AAA-like domain-containing protein [Acidobacteria bacterium]|nr:AAA-like domain-containing protein [Acidobacteriota bacterium]
MNSDRWKRVNEIYYAALELNTPERGVFLDTHCANDQALRAEISSLLASNDEAGDFMNPSALELAAQTVAAESAQPQIGERIGHYKIVSPLGAGGMGEIYLAEDTRLNRKVALKLLPHQFTRDADRVRRFKQEARAASALNHPHIVTIFEIGEERGWHYIVTEFIDGQTLRQRLAATPIKLPELAEIITQVASALAAAHEAGIVHRDIKPENIMVRRDGYVKVLDFGIAKLTEQFGVDRPTRTDSFASLNEAVNTDPGHVMGTAHYISPDQLLGLELDGRSDVFSLGVVLYELLTGRLPFDGTTPSAVIASILCDDPLPLARFSRAIPAELERIVEKALRKDREERYQVIKDFALDLKSLRLELEMEAKLKRSSVAFASNDANAELAVSSVGMPTNTMPPNSGKHARDIIAKLEPVGGAVPLDSSFYIERSTDREFHEAITRQDSLVLVKGARQVGKTSLLARGLQRAREHGAKIVLTDFQSLSADYLASSEKLILTLAETLADQLGLAVYPSEIWNSFLSPGINFERFLRREVLGKIETQLVWGLDEVDRLFSCDFGSDIFGLFRSWHNKRALDPEGPWRRLTMVIGYATEAHLFITDLNQSPFNVGTRLALEDFDLTQVAELNRRYGSPLRDRAEIARYFRLLSGHPYLVRRGLHELIARDWTLPDLEAHADQDEGPFGDHLRRMLVSLTQDPALCEVVQNVLQGRPSANTDSFYRLRSAGLMAGDSVRDLRPRCQLYATYLEKHLL